MKALLGVLEVVGEQEDDKVDFENCDRSAHRPVTCFSFFTCDKFSTLRRGTLATMMPHVCGNPHP